MSLLEDSRTRTYSFHGLGITISCSHPPLLEAVHSRLRQFQVNHQKAPDMEFNFCFVPNVEEHLVERPTGEGRSVYDPPLGEIQYFDCDDLYYINYGDRTRVLCTPAEGSVQLSILESEKDNLWLLSHPMVTLPLIELLKRHGMYNVHAAGLSINGRAILFPGTSGSGKSTVSIALSRAGFGFLADDTVFLRSDQDGLRVLSFPDEIDVTDDTVEFFPELHYLSELPKAPGWPKRSVWAEQVLGAEFISDSKPAFLVFPRIAHEARSILKPMDPNEALLELVSNIILTEAISSQAHLDILAQLVRESECYRLETGWDFADLPTVIKDLVR